MVLKGQFLERPTLIASGGFTLEALWHRGKRRPGLLIVPPTSNEGGMDHVICAELTWAASQSGFPTLRFNFRGVGASQGLRSTETAADDVRAALTLMSENTEQPVCAIAAVGSGARIIAQLSKDEPHAICCIQPPPETIASLAEMKGVTVFCSEDDTAIAETAAAASVQATVVPGSDRQFRTSLHQLGAAVVSWLQSR